MNLVPLHGIQALSNELKVRRKTITQFSTFLHMGLQFDVDLQLLFSCS